MGWTTKSGEKRYGHATEYLSLARIGEYITVAIKPSIMKLPSSHTAPVVMAGLGTGMAPFRGFIQERWYWKQQGVAIGPMVLYFGSRHRAMEYLYSEELEAYLKDNVLTSIRLAFSRDQPEKIYIQNHIKSDSDELNSMLVSQKGSFYLCGPTWPVSDVTEALLYSFSKTMTNANAEQYLDDMKSSERFVPEVLSGILVLNKTSNLICLLLVSNLALRASVLCVIRLSKPTFYAFYRLRYGVS